MSEVNLELGTWEPHPNHTAGMLQQWPHADSPGNRHLTHPNPHDLNPWCWGRTRTTQPLTAKATATTVSRKLISLVAHFLMSALCIQHLSPTVWLAEPVSHACPRAAREAGISRTWVTCLSQSCKGSWDNEFLQELGTGGNSLDMGSVLKVPELPHYR